MTGYRGISKLLTMASLFVGLLLICSCATGSYINPGSQTVSAGSEDTNSGSGRPGTNVVGLKFVQAWENTPANEFYPLEGLANCCYGADGTLIVCDEKRGKVFGLDNRTQRWFEFDSPSTSMYRPVDVRIDGFKVLVLDMGLNRIYRFDLSGAFLDRLVDVRQVDPAYQPLVTSFDIDRDGRVVIADVSEHQVLMLDAFMGLHSRISDRGSSSDMLMDPSGLTFLPDGSFLVCDRGNRRVSHYGRLGFFEQLIGGDFDLNNPFLMPQSIDSDRFGNVFVADQGNGQVHVLNKRLQLAFSAGRDFSLLGTPTSPIGVAVGPDGQLAITDRARSAILIYQIIYE